MVIGQRVEFYITPLNLISTSMNDSSSIDTALLDSYSFYNYKLRNGPVP
jgi:hypothetical protein